LLGFLVTGFLVGFGNGFAGFDAIGAAFGGSATGLAGFAGFEAFGEA
jgi:hypothetical protein